MKNFPPRFIHSLFGCLAFIFVLGGSSCSPKPPRLLFANHPVPYQKTEHRPASVHPVVTAPLTASAAATPAVLAPAYADHLNQAQAAAPAEPAPAKNTRNQAVNEETTRKAQVAVAKNALRQLKAVRKESKKLGPLDQKNTQANGLVTNKTALIVILVGLVLLLFNAGVGSAVVLVGAILLLLNYI